MKQILKRSVTAFLAAGMMLSAFSGCGGAAKADPAASAPAASKAGEQATENVANGEIPPFKVGFAITAAGSTHELSLVKVVKEAAEAMGGEVIVDNNMVYTPEGQISSVENLIQAGADIISFCAVTGDATLAKVAKICEDNKVYLNVWDTDIADPEVKKAVETKEYFAGSTNEDQVKVGYDGIKRLVDMGSKNIVIVKMNDGMTTLDLREQGANKAAEELGAKIVYKIVNPEDPAKAMQDVMTAHPDVDGLYILGVTRKYATPMINVINNSGKKINVGAIDFADEIGSLLKDGTLKFCYGGHAPTAYFSTLMAINKMAGTPLSDAPYKINIEYLCVESEQDVEDYFAYIAGDVPVYRPEDTKNMVKLFNPALTPEAMQEFASAYSMKWVQERNK